MNTTSKESYVSSIEADQGIYGLGHTSEQRSAEIVAALRAEVVPSPEAIALSSLRGQVFAKLLIRFVHEKPIINATLVRQLCMTELLKQVLRSSPPDITVVEIAAGFSARGMQVAQDFPQVQVLEVDLPDVVQEKRRRLKKARNITIPSNISWISGDLAVIPLDQLLGGKTIDVVIAEGLLPYFHHDKITQIVTSFFKILPPGGVMIADMVNATGWEVVQANVGFAANMLVRQIGKFPGTVEKAEIAEALFRTVGYQQVTVYHQSQLARELDFPVSADTSYLVTATKSVS